LHLLFIATIAARIKKNRPGAASQSRAEQGPQRRRAPPLDVFARSITFKAEKPRASSPATAFLRKGTTQ
jgi:hypothetical protein